MSTSAGHIVEIEAEPGPPPGRERNRATFTGFALALAVASAAVGRDGPEALAPIASVAEIAMPVPAQSTFVATTQLSNGWVRGGWLQSTVYDRTGTELLYQFWDENREIVTFLPPVIGSVGPRGALEVSGRTVVVYTITPVGSRYWFSTDPNDFVDVEGISE